MVTTTYNSTEDMSNKIQELTGKTKLKLYKKITNYSNKMQHKNFQSQQDTLAKNAQGFNKIYHEVMLLMKLLQTKPQVENMNNKYYVLYYTVNKNRREKDIEEEQKETVDNQYENVFIIPNHYVGKKGREKMRSQKNHFK